MDEFGLLRVVERGDAEARAEIRQARAELREYVGAVDGKVDRVAAQVAAHVDASADHRAAQDTRWAAMDGRLGALAEGVSCLLAAERRRGPALDRAARLYRARQKCGRHARRAFRRALLRLPRLIHLVAALAAGGGLTALIQHLPGLLG